MWTASKAIKITFLSMVYTYAIRESITELFAMYELDGQCY